MRQAIVNLATEGGRNNWYRRGQARLKASLNGRFDGAFVAFSSEEQVGAPRWNEVAAAFKLYAMREVRQMGIPMVCWMDSSLYAVGDTEPIFRQMREAGVCLVYSDKWMAGNWCSDAALKQMGLNRETMMGVREVWAAMVGVNFDHPVGKALFDEWWRLCHDGITFAGDYSNDRGQVSSDPRVKGHRQDQSALSGLAHKMKLPVLDYGAIYGPVLEYAHGA